MTNLTEQQQAVVDAILVGKSIRVSACAGSGKSSTIAAAIKQLPMDVSVLYLVFNKANQLEMEERLKDVACNIAVKTAHSLAYKTDAFKVMLTRPKGAYRNVLGTAREVEMGLKIPNYDNISGRAIAAAVIASVNKFECSSALGVSTDSSVINMLAAKNKLNTREKNVLNDIVWKYAKTLWARRLSKQALATHNTYLKLYSLSAPKLPYDVVCFDECQDANGSMKAVLDANIDKQIVLVGDPNQAVYQFNYCTDLFPYFPKLKMLPMTKSFRFGDNLAKLSACWVNSLRGASYDFQGTGSNVEIHFDIDQLDIHQPHTVLFRRNASMIEAALAYHNMGVIVKLGKTVVDGIIKEVVELGLLHAGRMSEIKNPELLLFSDWEQYCEDDSANDWLVQVIEAGATGELLKVLGEIRDGDADSHVSFVTVHRSKGLEYDTVVLWDDVLDLGRKPDETDEKLLKRLSDATINIGYVAATRAKKKMFIKGGMPSIIELPDGMGTP